MKPTNRFIILGMFICLIFPIKNYSQIDSIPDSTEDRLMLAARDIMEASRTCALITLDEQSAPMVRIMDPFSPEEDFTVWFGTKAESRKVDQIKNNPVVTLYYQDKDASGYVVIHGEAEIIDDPEEKQNRWKEAWKAFYPNNREGYLLMKVSPEWMEILSYTRGIVGDPETWQTPIVRFD